MLTFPGWGISVSIDSDYRLDNWGYGIQSPAETKGFSFSLCVQTCSEVHPVSYPMCRDKAQPGHDADHSSASSAEDKNEKELYLLTHLVPAWR
jgi:hypothetical protein